MTEPKWQSIIPALNDLITILKTNAPFGPDADEWMAGHARQLESLGTLIESSNVDDRIKGLEYLTGFCDPYGRGDSSNMVNLRPSVQESWSLAVAATFQRARELLDKAWKNPKHRT